MQPQQYFQLAKQAYAKRNFTQAISYCDQLLAQMGARDDLLNLKALSLLALGKLEDAEASINQAIKINPRIAGMHLNAGRIYRRLSRNKLVRRHAREAIRFAAREPAVLYQAALLYRDCADYQQALRVIGRCLSIQPDLSAGWQLKGSILTDIGDFEAAQTALEKSVALPPGNARALSLLVKIRRDSLADVQTVALLEQIRSSASQAPDRGTATFTLANMHRREQQYEQAFELYLEANKIMATLNPFDMDGWQQSIEKTIQTSSENDGLAATTGNDGSNLVFIVGMPRSGTSLCEQVLSTNPTVLACGELSAMQDIEKGLARAGGAKDPELATSRYLEALPKDYQKYQLVTDKAPMNFERIGFISELFPGARFLYCTRDPLDTILSCFIQNFQAGLNFASRLEHITGVFIAHQRIMRHWQTLMPGKIHTVNYESMVTDLETQARAMATFLQLDFDPAMLQPHRQQRAVTTASNLQVRKPVYTTSIGNWKNYAAQLQVAVDLLKDAE